MKIQGMFRRPIDREINGVVKVGDEEDSRREDLLAQELEEYVVTNELRGHFAKFYEAYERSIDFPTEKTGVWISGFFGSGKSHFLKMLSYLLENKVVGDRPALRYFTDDNKFQDELLEARVARCAKLPTESILFNIDNKGSVNKDKTAVLRVFARMFYDHLDYFGSDLKLARMERFIETQGKTEAFREAYERLSGFSWINDRQNYDLRDQTAEALEAAGVMSIETAERWLDGDETRDFSVDALTDDIRDYVISHGRDFRLLFCVDEIGQYIGGDIDLMLNLQTIVEQLGTKCAGQVWVIVTSQEAIDEVTKTASDTFSKIQGRFDTRLSLSSSSVDEVIKLRILEKNEVGRSTLQAQYATQSSVLRNLFTFDSTTQGDLYGYGSETDFVATFPFASYQFRIMPDVLYKLRTMGYSGKHLSGGERSMLSGFKEAAMAVGDLDENALVPFWRFYDTLQDFLEGHVRRVIERCTRAGEAPGQGLEPGDVNVLKALFLIRYIDQQVKGTVENVAILMASDMRQNKADLRDQVQASLDRLVHENYVARNANGDTYTFLTNEEQDIAREISRTQVDAARVVGKIGQIVFGDIYDTRRYRRDNHDFGLERYVDEALYDGGQGGIVLRIVTSVSEMRAEGQAKYLMRSQAPEAIVVLGESEDYFSVLLEAAKIEQFVRNKNVSELPKSTQRIIRSKSSDRSSLERSARASLNRAIEAASIYVGGTEFTGKGTSSARMDAALSVLVDDVYGKLGYVDKGFESDADIRTTLIAPMQTLPGAVEPNQRAITDVLTFLTLQEQRNLATSMDELQRRYQAAPYGWREIDVAGVVAQLVAGRKAVLSRAGKDLDPCDRDTVNYLRRKNLTAQCTVSRRVAVDEVLLRNARDVYKEWADLNDAPSEEESLVAAVTKALQDAYVRSEGYLKVQYQRNSGYPGLKVVEDSLTLYGGILNSNATPTRFLKKFVDSENDLLDTAEDLADVFAFFGGQYRQYDEARAFLDFVSEDEAYLEPVEEARDPLAAIRKIIESDRPYRQIASLPGMVSTLKSIHTRMVREKKNELQTRMDEIFAEIDAYLEGTEIANVMRRDIEFRKLNFRGSIQSAKTLVQHDALKSRLDALFSKTMSDIDACVRQEEARKRPQPRPRREEGPEAQPAKNKDIATVQRVILCPPRVLESEDEIATYVERIQSALIERLKGHDAIRID